MSWDFLELEFPRIYWAYMNNCKHIFDYQLGLWISSRQGLRSCYRYHNLIVFTHFLQLIFYAFQNSAELGYFYLEIINTLPVVQCMNTIFKTGNIDRILRLIYASNVATKQISINYNFDIYVVWYNNREWNALKT